MANLNLLENLIKNAILRPPSEKAAEEYFDQIVSYVEQEKIKEAAKLIENVFAKDVPDIRLIVYYLYAHFTDNGIKSFGKTFPIIKSLVSEHMEILTPKNRIDKHIQSSLNWFFSHLLQRLKYYEKLHNSGKDHAVWKKSVLEASSDDLNQLIAIAQEFNQFFLEKWPQSQTKDRVLHLVKKIEDIRKIVVEREKPTTTHEEIEEQKEQIHLVENRATNSETYDIEKTSSPTIISEVLEEGPKVEFVELDNRDLNNHNSTADAMKASNEIKIPDGIETPVQIETSPNTKVSDKTEAFNEIEEQSKVQNQISLSSKEGKEAIGDSLHFFIEKLDHLSLKLKIFETLIGKNDYLKAAVVANDIDHLIENFDPLTYFPNLFAKYFSLFAKHVTALTEQYEKKESLQVKALEKLYRTDLEMFMDW